MSLERERGKASKLAPGESTRQEARVTRASVDGRRMRAGDLIEIRSAAEILETLDSQNMLDGLLFMPEMLDLCGKRLRVASRPVQICTDGTPVPKGESRVRTFKNDDVVILEGPRCSGSDYGGCQRRCTLFWKEAWLRPVQDSTSEPQSVLERVDPARGQLRTQDLDGRYLCQSSTILESTVRLPRGQRLSRCVRNVAEGNCTWLGCVRMVASWVYWKVRMLLFGVQPRGSSKRTATKSKNLQQGDRVRVRPLHQIVPTLDVKGCNRGLRFSPDMVGFCGREFVVAGRVDRIVMEGYGTLRDLKDTVILDGVTTDNACGTFGGDPRDDYHYWREIWLDRLQ